MDFLRDFLSSHSEALVWVAGFSIITFVISVIMIPIVITRLPSNYFTHSYRKGITFNNSFTHTCIRVVKNIVGLLLVVCGLVMFFIPGQGILTMLIGLGLMNFPGKFAMEKKIVSRPAVYKSLNWIRSKADVEPLQSVDHEH